MRNAFKAIVVALVCALAFSPALTQTAMADTLPAALTQPSSEQQKAESATPSPEAAGADAADPAQTSAGNPSKDPGQNPPSQAAADQTSPSEAKPNATSSSQSPSMASKPNSTEPNHQENGTDSSNAKPSQNKEAADATSSAQLSDTDKSASDSQTQDKQNDKAQNDTAVITSPEENSKQQATVEPQSSCTPVSSQRWGDSDVHWSIDAGCTLHISGGTSPDIRPTDNIGDTDIPWVTNDTYRNEITKVSIEGNLTVKATKEAKYQSSSGYYTGLFASMSQLNQFSITAGAALALQDSAATFMFHNCTNLTNLDLSRFNTSNATNMSYMFLSCTGLTSLNLTGLDTSNVTDMSGMFNGCSGLTNLDLSNFNTTGSTNMSNMFNGSNALTRLAIGPKTYLASNSSLVGQNWYRLYGEAGQAPTPQVNTSTLISNTQRPGGAKGVYVTTLSGNYTVKFDGNGATTGSVGDIMGNVGNSITIPNSGTLNNHDRTFAGWNTQRDGSGTTYLAGNTVHPPEGTTVLYARWANDGQAPVVNPDKTTFKFGEAVSGKVLEREGGSPEAYDIITITWHDGTTSTTTSGTDGT